MSKLFNLLSHLKIHFWTGWFVCFYSRMFLKFSTKFDLKGHIFPFHFSFRKALFEFLNKVKFEFISVYWGIFIFLLTLQSSWIEFKFRKSRRWRYFSLWSNFRALFRWWKPSSFWTGVDICLGKLWMQGSFSAKKIKLFPLTPKQWQGGALSGRITLTPLSFLTFTLLSGRITFTPLSL